METLTQQIFEIQPPPGWVELYEIDIADESRYMDTPFFYLLVDFQENVRDSNVQSYRRTVQKINDASRIEDASLFTRELFAYSQRIVFHSVDIIRDGNRFQPWTRRTST